MPTIGEEDGEACFPHPCQHYDVLVSFAAKMITQDHKLSGLNTMHVYIMSDSGGQECRLGPSGLRLRYRQATLLLGSS